MDSEMVSEMDSVMDSLTVGVMDNEIFLFFALSTERT